MRTYLALGALLLLPVGVLAQGAFTALHPEAAIPDSKGQVTPDPYSNFIKLVQEALLKQGFAAGPLNGDFGEKTQAALAQFQLSRNLPASGSLDDQTLAELGVQREVQQAADAAPAEAAAAGGSAAPAQGQPPAEAPPKPEATAQPEAKPN